MLLFILFFNFLLFLLLLQICFFSLLFFIFFSSYLPTFSTISSFFFSLSISFGFFSFLLSSPTFKFSSPFFSLPFFALPNSLKTYKGMALINTKPCYHHARLQWSTLSIFSSQLTLQYGGGWGGVCRQCDNVLTVYFSDFFWPVNFALDNEIYSSCTTNTRIPHIHLYGWLDVTSSVNLSTSYLPNFFKYIKKVTQKAVHFIQYGTKKSFL